MRLKRWMFQLPSQGYHCLLSSYSTCNMVHGGALLLVSPTHIFILVSLRLINQGFLKFYIGTHKIEF